MNTVKNDLLTSWKYLKTFLKWIFFSVILGGVGGTLGSLFHISIDEATELRNGNHWIIFLLPVGGLIIAAMYSLFRKIGKLDTNRVIESVHEDKSIPVVTAPLIFISTVLTHLFGGSAGREGAALQLGGSLGYNLGKLFRLNKNDVHIIVMTGMSSVFAAMFGTPLTAAVFAIEVISVGVMHYAALVPCIIASVVACNIAHIGFGLSPISFEISNVTISFDVLSRVIILSLLCAVICIVFCGAIKICESWMKKYFPNSLIRAAIGGIVIVLLTLLVRTYAYNGAGMDIISRAISGEARPEAFALKIVFTVLTIAAGFKGGEIVPSFFIGSTFGCVVGSFLGIDAGFGAAVGFVALFCGVVNCPIASILLALEVFGADSIMIFAIVCGVSFMMSGNSGLYKSQKIVYSKLDEEYIDVNTN